MTTGGLSIVIPAYDAAETVGRTLASLAGESWDGPWEVIVADNGSADDTVQRAKEFGDQLPSLRIVDASMRSGASAARNVGARAARFAAIAWLDADDEVRPGWLRAMATAAEHHEFFCATTTAGGPNPVIEHAGRPEQRSRLSNLFADRNFLDAAPGNSLASSRRLFDEIGGFDEEMRASEDTAFCWEAQLRGHPLVRVEGAVVTVYARADNRSLARQQFIWGYGSAQLRHRFEPRGMPRASAVGAGLRWVGVLGTSPLAIISPSWRRRWIGIAARRVGRLVGGLRDRRRRDGRGVG